MLNIQSTFNESVRTLVLKLIVHDHIELFLEAISGQLLRVRLLPLVVKRLDLEGIVILDAWQRSKRVCTATVIEVMSDLN